MRVRAFLLVSLLLLSIPAAAWAGAPFTTPPELSDLPDLPEQAQGSRPDPLPSADAGIPDLVGVVDLPEGAIDHVIDQAPPFGGEHGNRFVTSVPEPTTGALLALGLLAIAARKRASS